MSGMGGGRMREASVRTLSQMRQLSCAMDAPFLYAARAWASSLLGLFLRLLLPPAPAPSTASPSLPSSSFLASLSSSESLGSAATTSQYRLQSELPRLLHVLASSPPD